MEEEDQNPKDQIKEHLMGEWADALDRRERNAQLLTDLSVSALANIAISWGLVISALALTPSFNPFAWGLLIAGVNGLGSLPLLARENADVKYVLTLTGGRLAIAGVINGGLVSRLGTQASSDAAAINYLIETVATYQAGFPPAPPAPKFAGNVIVGAGAIALLLILLKSIRR